MNLRFATLFALSGFAFSALACAVAPQTKSAPVPQQTAPQNTPAAPQNTPAAPQNAPAAPQVTLGAPQPLLSTRATKAFEKLAVSIAKQKRLHELDTKWATISLDSRAKVENAYKDFSMAHGELRSAIEAACKATGDPAVDFAPAAAALAKMKTTLTEHDRLKELAKADDEEFQKYRSAWWAERDVTPSCSDAFQAAVKATLGKDADIDSTVDLERVKYHDQYITEKLAAKKGDKALAVMAADIAKLRTEFETALRKPLPAQVRARWADERNSELIEQILTKPIDANAAQELKELRIEAGKIQQQKQKEADVQAEIDAIKKAEQEAYSKYTEALVKFINAVE